MNYISIVECASMECEACFSRSYCTRCKAPYLAYRGDCVEHCPAGLHYAQYLKDCKEQGHSSLLLTDEVTAATYIYFSVMLDVRPLL